MWYAPNALTQIPQAESFDATVRLELQGKEDGDQIVFGMLGHKYTYLALQKAGEEYFVVLNEGNVTEITGKGKAEEKVLMKLPWKCNTLWIRIKMQKNAVYTYEYSEDGKNYTVLGDQRIFHAGVYMDRMKFFWQHKMQKIKKVQVGRILILYILNNCILQVEKEENGMGVSNQDGDGI